MADKRAFAKFDVGYLDNPKMLDILDASSNAILMHFASVLYCAQHLTDGVVASKAMQRKTGGTDTDAQILLDCGLWHEPGHDCESCPQPPAGKVYVHDFLEHNRDSAEAKRVSEKRSKAAKARWEGNATSMQSALQNEDVCNAERERKRESVPAARRKPEQPMPAGWAPTEAHKAYAADQGINLDFQAERFTSWVQAKDVRYRDWDAAFRNWLLKAEKTTTTKNALWDS